jgi:hypothetical protein
MDGVRLNANSDSIGENYRKLALYFKSHDSYLRMPDSSLPLKVDPGLLGRYGLDFKPQLHSGHFAHFDKAGLPLQRGRAGIGFVHTYTMMCGFALAHWDAYLLTGDEGHLQKLMAVATYILETGKVRGDGGMLLRTEKPGLGHIGEISSMIQGEAMSVLSRAWYVTRDQSFLDAAAACIAPFEESLVQGGILGGISAAGVSWYEEYVTEPLNHVLNGMIFALWGLRDLALMSDSESAKKLFDSGVESLRIALPLFDNGFWSWYWISEQGKPYIASMLYHNFHIAQLKSLALQTGVVEFKETAARFEGYSRSPKCRLMAASRMLQKKFGLAMGGRQSFQANLEEHSPPAAD